MTRGEGGPHLDFKGDWLNPNTVICTKYRYLSGIVLAFYTYLPNATYAANYNCSNLNCQFTSTQSFDSVCYQQNNVINTVIKLVFVAYMSQETRGAIAHGILTS